MAKSKAERNKLFVIRERKKWECHKKRNEFYSSKKWIKIRALAIEIYGTICRRCGANGPVNVDHIKPFKYYPWLRNRIDNLQILCNTCNKLKLNTTCDYRTANDCDRLLHYTNIRAKTRNSKRRRRKERAKTEVAKQQTKVRVKIGQRTDYDSKPLADIKYNPIDAGKIKQLQDQLKHETT